MATDRHLIGLISATRALVQQGNGWEAMTPELVHESELPHPDDVLGPVVTALRALPEDEKGDSAAFEAALKTLVSHSSAAMARYRAGGHDPFTPDERASLEAVVKADGSRPSLLLRNGEANADHPLAGAWKEVIVGTRETVRRLAASVGRIEPARPTSRSYFGTGWVVDHAKGLVVTNRHVLDAMLARATTLYESKGTGYRIHEGVFMDFDCETSVDSVNRFRIVEATPARAAGEAFAELDVAILRIEAMAGEGGSRTDIPEAVRVRADSDAVVKRTLPSMCIVGFPGPPPATTGTTVVAGHGTIDWAWVDSALFGGGGKYGLKRLSPGLVDREVGHLGAADPRKWIFGHEATTLGGNSGSPVFAWTANAKGYAFGVHFSGYVIETNRAHAVANAADGLRALGVPVEKDDGW